MTWRIRWYLIITITIIYVLSLLLGFIAYRATKDFHFLFFLIPTVLIPFVHCLVPMDQKRYELKKRKIQATTHLQIQRDQKQKQVP